MTSDERAVAALKKKFVRFHHGAIKGTGLSSRWLSVIKRRSTVVTSTE